MFRAFAYTCLSFKPRIAKTNQTKPTKPTKQKPLAKSVVLGGMVRFLKLF
jgi:hypothetical protein